MSNDTPILFIYNIVVPKIPLHIATLGPVGYLPFAPGTWGTACALIILWLLKPSMSVYFSITAAVTVAGIYVSSLAERILNQKDPGHIVIDEFAGYLVSMMFLPVTAGYLIAAFVLFRGFDILKPPPIRGLQNLPGGWGVMVDDIAAGIYTNLILQIWRLWIWR